MTDYRTGVHGNNFFSEKTFANNSTADQDGEVVLLPPTSEIGQPFGWGRAFKSFGWHHVAIPISAPLQDRWFLKAFWVSHETNEHTRLDEIHLWDGNRRIHTMRPIFSSPNRLREGFIRGTDTFFELRPAITFFSALGISVHTTAATSGGQAGITFFQAGAIYSDQAS